MNRQKRLGSNRKSPGKTRRTLDQKKTSPQKAASLSQSKKPGKAIKAPGSERLRPKTVKQQNKETDSRLSAIFAATLLGLMAIALVLYLANSVDDIPSSTSMEQQLPLPGQMPPAETAPELTDPDTENPPPRQLPEGNIGEWAKNVVYIEGGVRHMTSGRFRKTQSGTGFLFADSGLFLTNEHVIAGCQTIILTFYDGSRREAEVVRSNAELDIALLRANLPVNIKGLSLGNDRDVTIGRKILVMGFPLGSRLGSEMTLTEGIVSSVRFRDGSEPFWYQVSAAVNPGNSGGPLLDENTGEVLGVVTAKVNEAENIGYARPMHVLRRHFLRR